MVHEAPFTMCVEKVASSQRAYLHINMMVFVLPYFVILIAETIAFAMVAMRSMSGGGGEREKGGTKHPLYIDDII